MAKKLLPTSAVAEMLATEAGESWKRAPSVPSPQSLSPPELPAMLQAIVIGVTVPQPNSGSASEPTSVLPPDTRCTHAAEPNSVVIALSCQSSLAPMRRSVEVLVLAANVAGNAPPVSVQPLK